MKKLKGYKKLEQGYVWLPYIPVYTKPIVVGDINKWNRRWKIKQRRKKIEKIMNNIGNTNMSI